VDPPIQSAIDGDRTLSIRPRKFEDDKRSSERRAGNVRILTGSTLVIAILYVARQVFIPIALAILFSFLLRPIVQILERTFLRRSGAIVLALGFAVAGIGLGGWSLATQISGMAKEMVSYTPNIEQKLSFLRRRSAGTLALFEKTIQKVADSTQKVEHPDMKVRVIPEKQTLAERYELIAPTVEFTAAVFLVIVLVFFLLKDREQLRDKMLRLAGRANLTVTTQAIGETSERISRFLLTQALINATFGLMIGIGLLLMGMPHSMLWGVLAALLRFIPYVGAALSAAMPTVLALAIFPGWYVSLGVLGLFLLIDQTLSGFIEPLLIGHRVGVSPIALLVAAIFWGWLWGPVGLILATPITVCLTVAGEFIPALRVFSILFGTEAPLEGYLSFYNRLLLRDRTGALAFADRAAEDTSMEATFMEVFVPTLSFAAEERAAKRISPANDHFIKDVIREAIIRLGDVNSTVTEPPRRAVAVSVAGERLSLGTLMLTQILRSDGMVFDYFTDLPLEELLAYLKDNTPDAIFISCSNPAHLEEGYAMMKKITEHFSESMIVAGGSAFAADAEKTVAAGARFVPTSLSDAKEEFQRQLRRSRRRGPRTFSGSIRIPNL
jgi:predicted PurR-regulated permease PerM/methylmalonyl-CoA mutase cobalamin-binding subunit